MKIFALNNAPYLERLGRGPAAALVDHQEHHKAKEATERGGDPDAGHHVVRRVKLHPEPFPVPVGLRLVAAETRRGQ